MQFMSRDMVMVFNTSFNNISVISRWSVLLMEETGVPGENHTPSASHWLTLSHNVKSSTSRLNRIWTHNVSACQNRICSHHYMTKKIATLESLLKTKFEFCVLYGLSQTVFVYNPQDVVNKRLWKENLNDDGQRFHQYQQNNQSPLTSNHSTL